MDQLDGRNHEERQQTSHLSRSEGSKSRDPARKLPATDDWRYRDAAARSQGVHRPWRPPWVLARAPRQSLVISDDLPHTFWQVSVQTHAVWHQFSPRSFPEENERTDRGTTRYRGRGWWFRCRRIRQHGWRSERWPRQTTPLISAAMWGARGQTERRQFQTETRGGAIEVARLNTVTTRSVLRELLPMFAIFGLPDVLVSDNGPQFASAEFAMFVKQTGITPVTSSPNYAQSNGKADNAVKTLKLLFAKAKQSGESEYMALLDWRNTPSEGMSTSPAQRLMGRRCKTLLPTAGTMLKPRYDTDADTRALAGRKRRQSFYYNQHARPLTPIDEGATVRMKLPGEKTWTPGTCTGQVNPRSYRVKVGGTVYRRNRRQLVCAGEDPRDETSRYDATSPPERDDSPLSDRIPETHSPPVARSAYICARVQAACED